MPRKYRDPEAPEVLEAVLQRIRGMTREEWLQELAGQPEAAEETERTLCSPDGELPESAAMTRPGAAPDPPPTPEPLVLAASPKRTHR